MRRRLAATLAVTAAACGEPPPPAPLAPLPPPAPADTDRFADAARCGQCHTAGDDTQLRDAAGRDVSPLAPWRASMMALAARDPMYLAVVSDELAHAADPAAVGALCTRCHAPAGSEERRAAGLRLGLDELVGGDDPAARLAREGVTCTLCHQLAAAGLGEERSFSGGFTVGFDRALFGPHAQPLTGPMQMFVRYTPTYGPHVGDSALCGTCHTVIVPAAAGGEVVEQATYLEWRSSVYAQAPAVACASCHLPTRDEDGAAIATRIARYPDTLAARAPVGRHLLVGGNRYMLELLAGATDWLGAGVSADELRAAAARTEAFLATAAAVTIVEATRDGGGLIVRVRVDNRTGHKLPTGYPSRRAWLHLRVAAGAATVFESGATDADGRLVDGRGRALAEDAPLPHRTAITADDQVQVYEAVLVDADGLPTHRALVAADVGKDNRLLPAGWRPAAADARRVATVGVIADPDFTAGGDTVTYRIAAVPAGELTIDAALRHAATSPAHVATVAAIATPAGARFAALAAGRPVAASLLASARAIVAAAR
jgi:hypothetical protein